MRIGLTLSGGGLRATLFHTGLIKYLADSKLLSSVTNICSVSGGSIAASHLVHNWEEYLHDSASAIDKLVAFTKSDVRGNIGRRFIFHLPVYLLLQMLSSLTGILNISAITEFLGYRRTSLLIRLYHNGLYYRKSPGKDGHLKELMPTKDCFRPLIDMLSTDLHTGRLCSFSNYGFSSSDPNSHTIHDFTESRNFMIAKAVAASSAFPAFFPPLRINHDSLNTKESHIKDEYILTDGGVIDNIGIRKLQQNIETGYLDYRVIPEDILDVTLFINQFAQMFSLQSPNPARCFKFMLAFFHQSINNVECLFDLSSPSIKQDICDTINADINRKDLFDTTNWHHSPAACDLFANIDGFSYTELRFKNRKAVSFAFSAIKLPTLDYVIVSNAQQPFRRQREPGFIIGTALRSSDILMSRIYGLERDRLNSNKCALPNTIFCELDSGARVQATSSLDNSVDPDLLNVLPNMRTDLDACSDLEIDLLTRAGYSIAHSVLADQSSLATQLHDIDRIWSAIKRPIDMSIDSQITTIKASSIRPYRWFKHNDWVSYVILIVLVAAIFIPCLAFASVRNLANQIRYSAYSLFTPSVSQNGMVTLVPDPPLNALPAMSSVDTEVLAVTVESDKRIYDFRDWKLVNRKSVGQSAQERSSLHRHIVIKKNNTCNNFYVPLFTSGDEIQISFMSTQDVPAPTLLTKHIFVGIGLPDFLFDRNLQAIGIHSINRSYLLKYDISRLECGKTADLRFVTTTVNGYQNSPSEWLTCKTLYQVKELDISMLMPYNKPLMRYDAFSYPVSKREKRSLLNDQPEVYYGSRLLHWTVRSLELDCIYEVEWFW